MAGKNDKKKIDSWDDLDIPVSKPIDSLLPASAEKEAWSDDEIPTSKIIESRRPTPMTSVITGRSPEETRAQLDFAKQALSQYTGQTSFEPEDGRTVVVPNKTGGNIYESDKQGVTAQSINRQGNNTVIKTTRIAGDNSAETVTAGNIPTSVQMNQQFPSLVNSQTEALSKEGLQRAQQTAKYEINSSKQYISNFLNDYKEQMANTLIFDPAAKKPMQTIGQNQENEGMFSQDNYVNKLFDDKADPKAMSTFVGGALGVLETEKAKALNNLKSKYTVNSVNVGGLNIDLGHVETQPQSYKDEAAKISQDFNKKAKELLQAANSIASLKSVNSRLEKLGASRAEELSPLDIGMEVVEQTGNSEQVRKDRAAMDRGKALDPETKVMYENRGYQAMDYAKYDQLANDRLPAAEALAQKTDNYHEKILSANPAFVKQQIIKALSAQIYKDENAVLSAVTDNDPTQADILSAAQKLGFSKEQISGITPMDIQNPKVWYKRIVGSFVNNSAGGIYKLGMRGAAATYNALGGDVDWDAFNDHYNQDWYTKNYNSVFGGGGAAFIGGEAPGSGLFGDQTKVNTDVNSPSFLMNEKNPNATKFTWDPRAILNQVADGAGQIAAFGYGGGEIAKAYQGIRGAATTAKGAQAVGTTVSTFLTQYADNYSNAVDALGQAPKDEGKRNLYAILKTASSALTEQILPDAKIVDDILGAGTVAGRELIGLIRQNGASALKSKAVKDIILRGIKTGVVDWQKEISEDILDETFGAGIDAVLAPDQLRNKNLAEDLKQTYITSAISSIIPTMGGAMQASRNQSKMQKSALFEVGSNPETYIDEINSQLAKGDFTEAEAKSRIDVVQKLSDIVDNEVPDVSPVSGKPLTATQKMDYTHNLISDHLLMEQAKAVNDPVQRKINEKRINELQQERENILGVTPASVLPGQVAASNPAPAATATDNEANPVTPPAAPTAVPDELENLQFEDEPQDLPATGSESKTAVATASRLPEGLGEPVVSTVDNGQLYEFRTPKGLVAGVMTSPTHFRIDGISAAQTGQGQGSAMFENLIGYLKEKGVKTISTVSAGEGAQAMHQRAVDAGLITEVAKDGRTATFAINENPIAETKAVSPEVAAVNEALSPTAVPVTEAMALAAPETAPASPTEATSARVAEINALRPTPTKPFDQMNSFELDAHADNLRAFDKDLEKNIFGADYAEWKQAQSVSNSNFAPRDKQKQADETINRLEAALPKEMQDLLYGIGTEGIIDGEEIRDMANAVSVVEMQDTVEGLANIIRNDIITLGGAPQNIADYNSKQERSRLKMLAAKRRADELGIPSTELSQAAFKAAAAEFSDPADAEFMLSKFFSEPAPTADIQEPPQLAMPIVEEAVPTPIPSVNEIGVSPITTPLIDFQSKSGNRVYRDGDVLKVVNRNNVAPASQQTINSSIIEAAESAYLGDGQEAPVIEEYTPEHVAETSFSPAEVAANWMSIEAVPTALSTVESAIADYAQSSGFNTTTKSFTEYSDRAYITNAAARAWINEKEGSSLDRIAQSISNNRGVEVGPEDVANFIIRFRNGVAEAYKAQPNPAKDALAKRFEQLTGFPLTDNATGQRIADIALEQYADKFTQKEKQFLANEYENSQQLRDEYEGAIIIGDLDTPTENSRNANIKPTSSQSPVEGTQPGKTPDSNSASNGQDGTAEQQGKQLPESQPTPIPETVTESPIERRNKLVKAIVAKERRLELMELRDDKGGKVWKDERARTLAEIKNANRVIDEIDAQLAADKKESRALQRKAAADAIRSLKSTDKRQYDENGNDITPAKSDMFGGLPNVLYNAALERVARFIEDGNPVIEAIQNGVDFISDRFPKPWNDQGFRDSLKIYDNPDPNNPSDPATTAQNIRNMAILSFPLSEKNKAQADILVEAVIAGRKTLAQVEQSINSSAISDSAKKRIASYVRAQVEDQAYRQPGVIDGRNLIANNNGDFDAALVAAGDNYEVALLAATSNQEKEDLKKKYAATITYIQTQKTISGVTTGIITPVSVHLQTANSFKLPVQGKMQKRIQQLQDRYVRLQQAQNAAIAPVDERTNAVDALRLAKAKAWNTIDEIREYLGDNKITKDSFYDRLNKAKVDIERFGLYMYAKHAPERNAQNAITRQETFDAKVYELNQQIAQAEPTRAAKLQAELDTILSQKNPDFILMPDGGSGMTNQQAADILKEVNDDGDTSKFEAFATEFKENVVNKILDTKYETGLLKDEEYAILKDAYKNYVPLKIDMDDEVGVDGTPQLKNTGRTGRDLYRSKGGAEYSYVERNNVILQAVSDLEHSVLKGEENKANIRMANLIRSNPNPDIWEVRPAMMEPVKNKDGQIKFMREVNRPQTGIQFWENGNKSYIILRDAGLAETFRRIPPNVFLKGLQGVTSFVRTFATLTNPSFIVVNPLLDMQDAVVNIMGEKNAALTKAYLKNVSNGGKAPIIGHMKIVKQILSNKGEWADLRKEWEAQGGKITFLSQTGLEGQAKKNLSIFQDYNKSKANPKLMFRAMKQGAENFSEALEIATRLAIYKSGLEVGMTKEKSAILSRDATVDFEKGGSYGVWLNAWKAFANAAVQGNANLIINARKSKVVRKVLGGAFLFGMSQAFLADMIGDCDDNKEDCYWEVPEYRKQKAIVVPMKLFGGHGFATIPIGRHFGWLNYLGQGTYGLIKNSMSDGQKGNDAGEFTANILGSFFNYFNPLGGDSPLAQQMAGNFAPVAGYLGNQNAFGGPIVPDNIQHKPDHNNFFPNTPAAYTEITKYLSEHTGGSDVREGAIEISPNNMEFVIQSALSGLYGFGKKIATLPAKSESPKGVQFGDVPILDRFYRESNMSVTKQKVRDLIDKSESNLLTQEERDALKKYYGELVEGNQYTEEQAGKALNYMNRNQNAIINREKKSNSAAAVSSGSAKEAKEAQPAKEAN